jgi:signal transduction histidine kinase
MEAILVVAVVLRRRQPLLAVAMAASASALEVALGVPVDQPLAPLLALAFTLYALGVYGTLRASMLGFVIVTASIAVGTKDKGIGNFAFGAIFTWGTLAAGRAMRGRVRQTDELARRAERERVEAVGAERARIARELHDVIAHSVSVMTIQAGAAEELLRVDPARAVEPVRAVQEAGRQALIEMKRLVGMLREDQEEIGLAPQPRLTDLQRLAARMGDAGLAVELRVEGTPREVPMAIELSAYRVAQEALTNTLKHARATGATVTLRYEPSWLSIEIIDDGAAAAEPGSGHGLVGMRERVSVFGGTLAAGPRPSGGFAVHALLPLETVP